MKRGSRVVASDAVAADAAEAHLRAGGDAIGAAVAGFFASAGEDPGVLFGALALLVAQVGVGARAFDGRQRQPGIGLKRPRGLLPEAEIPAAARIAAPTSIAALFVAVRYGPQAAMSRLMAPGIALAKKAGSARRAALLETIQRLGPSALVEAPVARALLHAAGPVEGGMLTEADLRAVCTVDHPASVDDAGLARVPWPSQGPQAQIASASELAHWREQLVRQQGLCVQDSRGCFAALCYDRTREGLFVDDLELLLPLNAAPVRRGVPRVTPGAFLDAPARIAIQLGEGGAPRHAETTLSDDVTPAVLRVGDFPSDLVTKLGSL